MSYKIEEVNSCTKKIAFSFENLDLTKEVSAALAEKRKTVNLKGFRKGKAPIAMVEKYYGPQVQTDAINRFVQNRFFEAVKEEDLRIVGYPQIDNMKYEGKDSMSFEAVVEVFPTVSLKDFSGYSFDKKAVKVEEKDIEDTVKNYLNPRAEMTELKDEGVTLENGQFAVLNFDGEKPDGERPENMKGREFLLEIGSGQFIPGFEEKMVGMKKGEKKDLDITFPEEYHAEELRSAKVKFEVELLEIKEKKLPELTDELAKEMGFESVTDMKEKTKKNIFSQKENEVKQEFHQSILEKLVKENQFDVPKTMIVQQEKSVQEDLKRNLMQQGFNEEMLKDYFSKWKDDVTSKAIFQVKSGLILDTLGKQFEIEASEEDFNKKLEEIASGSGMKSEQLMEYYGKDPKIKTNLMYAIREEKTFDQIAKKVKIKEI